MGVRQRIGDGDSQRQDLFRITSAKASDVLPVHVGHVDEVVPAVAAMEVEDAGDVGMHQPTRLPTLASQQRHEIF